MKKTIFFLLLIAAVGTGAFLLGRAKGSDHGGAAVTPQTKQLYTCGMHPQVIQDHPGNCPICGMKLEPVHKQSDASTAAAAGDSSARKIKYYKSSMTPGETSPNPGKDSMGMDMIPVYEDAAAPAATGSAVIAIDPVTIQSMGVRTAPVVKGPLKRKLRAVGVVDFDETSLTDVTTKFKGWIEKLYVDSTGAQVHQGDPLFEIYSPDIYSAQTEYLLVLNQMATAPGANIEALKDSARTKLKYYDVSDAQIAELEHSHKATKTLRVNASRDGIVVEKTVVQGQMVDAGMKLYRLADLAIVWVQAQIYEQDLPFVQLGQEATVSLSYLPDRKFRGRVTYIYPTVDDKTRTARVRMEFHNPGYFLKPGMFATAELEAELNPSVVLVPDSAVLRSGERNTVFIARDGGRFEPRVVTLGPRSEDDQYQVLSGLDEGERVVTSGQFLLDSESQLREAVQKMLNPNTPAASGPGTSMPTPAASIPSSNSPPAAPQPVVYICPMPEHVAIQYDHPGKCPICGMTLIPIAPSTLTKIPPGGAVDYYICPMTDACPTPGHGAVHYDKAGKCPVCGMTLIPILKAPPPATAATNMDTAHPN